MRATFYQIDWEARTKVGISTVVLNAIYVRKLIQYFKKLL